MSTSQATRFTAQCACGSVKLAIETLPPSLSPQPLRLVCYCKDCRGYYNTLNNNYHQKKKNAKLDPHGGVDWTCLYPRDITITQGKEYLTPCKIRPSSPIVQVYASCCYTPMIRFGSNSALLNTHTIASMAQQQAQEQQEEHPNTFPSSSSSALPDIRFHIIGRDAFKEPQVPHDDDEDSVSSKRPKISYSVPLSWFFVMMKRVKPKLMTPMPMEFNQTEKNDRDEISVLDNFQQG